MTGARLASAFLLATCAGALDARAISLEMKFPSDPVWANTPLSPNAPICRSVPEVDTGEPDQYPPDSSLTRFAGSFTVQVQGAPTAPIGGILRRSVINQQEAAGTGYPGGFTGFPSGSTPGGLTGMLWPFRDFLNFPGSVPPIPGGNDNAPGNGLISSLGVLDIDGAQDVSRFGVRQNTGDGVRTRMQVFALDFEATDFTPRILRVTFSGLGEVTTPNGVLRNIPITGSTTIAVVPAPAGWVLVGLAGLCAARRRRAR